MRVAWCPLDCSRERLASQTRCDTACGRRRAGRGRACPSSSRWQCRHTPGLSGVDWRGCRAPNCVFLQQMRHLTCSSLVFLKRVFLKTVSSLPQGLTRCSSSRLAALPGWGVLNESVLERDYKPNGLITCETGAVIGLCRRSGYSVEACCSALCVNALCDWSSSVVTGWKRVCLYTHRSTYEHNPHRETQVEERDNSAQVSHKPGVLIAHSV
jgi:hypothetical protein